MSTQDYEELLPDSRVQRLAEMLFLAFPELPPDTDVVTFIDPARVVEHEGRALAIPESAVFAVISDNPRNHIYKKKLRVMTTAGMKKSDWDDESRMRQHFVSPREDPAWKFLAIATRTHIDRLRNLRQLN